MSGRIIEAEILDQVSNSDARSNLGDLVRMNKWFGGHRIARSLLEELKPPPRFSLLDVGAASGDYARMFRKCYPAATVVSADWAERNLAGAPAPKVVADARRLPFCNGSLDYVFCSLLLHHLRWSDLGARSLSPV
jgi:ubiquinone/menaquinone biosynthesis C-methylase UbiE